MTWFTIFAIFLVIANVMSWISIARAFKSGKKRAWLEIPSALGLLFFTIWFFGDEMRFFRSNAANFRPIFVPLGFTFYIAGAFLRNRCGSDSNDERLQRIIDAKQKQRAERKSKRANL